MDSRGEAETQTNSSPTRQRTFSWVPLIVVCVCMAANYFMLTSVFPYVGFMVMDLTGVSADRAGFQAGCVAGSFALGRVMTTYVWGSAADYFGRKPVLVWSMMIDAVLAIAFGTSKTLYRAIAMRFLQGALTGTGCVSRVLVPELGGDEHVVTAMAMLAGIGYLGMTLGPAVGGLCAEPARHYPSVFSSTGLFGRYPYLLPNLVEATIALLCIPLVIIMVPETQNLNGGRLCRRRYMRAGEGELEKERDTAAVELSGVVAKYEALPEPVEDKMAMDPEKFSRNCGTDERDAGGGSIPELPRLSCAALGGRDELPVAPKVLCREEGFPVAPLQSGNATPGREDEDDDPGIFGKGGLLSIPNVPLMLVMGLSFSAVACGFDEVYPLWALSSHNAGGLEWDTPQIGTVMAIAGATVCLYQLFVYPWLADKIGIVTLQHSTGMLASLLLATLPNITYLSLEGSILPVSAFLIALTECSLVTTEVGLSLAATNPVPPCLRGKLSGLYLTCYYLGATSPWIWAIGFAWSISSGRTIPLVDHRFIFNSSALLVMLVCFFGLRVFTEESMTHVRGDLPSTPLRVRSLGISTPRSCRSSRRHFPSPVVSGPPRGDLV